MKRGLVKVAATLAIAGIVTGSTGTVAQAHHSRSYEYTAYCYEDGSCDVDGVCMNGADCDGSVHHAQSNCSSSYGSGYQSGGHHRSGHHH